MRKPQLLTPIRRVDDYIAPGGQHQQRWEYQCACGNIVQVVKGLVSSGNTRSCGCLRNITPDPVVGDVFGRLTVISEPYTPDGGTHKRCLCRCVCGNEHDAQIGNLKHGAVKSCGCLQSETASNKNTKLLLPGTVFGNLTVIDGPLGTPHKYRCLCTCGKIIERLRGNLVKQRGKTPQSCGCLITAGKHTPKVKELPIGYRVHRLTVSGKPFAKNKRWYHPCRCDCGNEVIVQTSHLSRDDRGTKSCGCLKIKRAQERCGVAHPNWRLDISEEERELSRNRHKVQECVLARDAAHKRDNYTCRACGKRGKIHAHHIMPWARYRYLQYEVSNLICLCSNCHKEIHDRLREDLDTGTDELDITTEWLKEKRNE